MVQVNEHMHTPVEAADSPVAPRLAVLVWDEYRRLAAQAAVKYKAEIAACATRAAALTVVIATTMRVGSVHRSVLGSAARASTAPRLHIQVWDLGG